MIVDIANISYPELAYIIGVDVDGIMVVCTCSFALAFHPKMGIEKYPQYFWSRLFFINFVVQTSGIAGQ